MKAKREAIANMTVILVALGVGYVVLARYVAAYRAPRPVSAGNRLAAIPNLDWKQHEHTLVLALNTGCHFCEQSVPFYRWLADTQTLSGSELEIVAVFSNEQEMVRQFMTREALRIRSVSAAPLDKLNVFATPTIMLVDNEGRVEKTWVGALAPREQLDLIEVLSTPSSGCSPGGLLPLKGRAKNIVVRVRKSKSKTKDGG